MAWKVSPSSATPNPPHLWHQNPPDFPSSATPFSPHLRHHLVLGWVGWGGMITSMFLCAHRHGNLITRELAVGLCPFLSLVVRFGRSAAQILQNGPRQLGQLGCAPCPFSGGPFWPLSSPNLSKRTSPALPLGGGGVGWDDKVHVPVRTQARQPHQTRAGGGSLSLSLPGGPFWPLSSPNPPKRTSPAWSAWLCSLLSLWWSVSAAQQPESFKTDLPSSSNGWGWGGGWGGVGWDDNVHVPVRTQARQPRQTRAGGGSLSLSLAGGPFWPLSSPNPPKRTSPAWSAWLCSLLSLWWSVLAAQQPKSSKTDLASLVCLAVLLALPLVFRFGRSAAQILQNGPCSPSGGPFEPLSSPNPSKRTCPTLPLAVGAGQGRTFNLQVKGLALCRLSYTSLAGNDLKILPENRYIQTGSHRKQPPQADSQEKREQTQVQPLCPVRPVKSRRSLSLSLPGAPFCHQAQHAPHKETIDGTKCHACHAKPHLASQPRDRVTVEETRPRHRWGRFPRHRRGAFQHGIMM